MLFIVVVCTVGFLLTSKQRQAEEERWCAVYSGRSPGMTFNKTCYYSTLSKAKASRCESSQLGNPVLKRRFVRKIEGKKALGCNSNNKANIGEALLPLSQGHINCTVFLIEITFVCMHCILVIVLWCGIMWYQL